MPISLMARPGPSKPVHGVLMLIFFKLMSRTSVRAALRHGAHAILVEFLTWFLMTSVYDRFVLVVFLLLVILSSSTKACRDRL